MIRNREKVSVGNLIILILVLLNAVILKAAYSGSDNWYWALIATAPLLFIAIRDRLQKKTCGCTQLSHHWPPPLFI